MYEHFYLIFITIWSAPATGPELFVTYWQDCALGFISYCYKWLWHSWTLSPWTSHVPNLSSHMSILLYNLRIFTFILFSEFSWTNFLPIYIKFHTLIDKISDIYFWQYLHSLPFLAFNRNFLAMSFWRNNKKAMEGNSDKNAWKHYHNEHKTSFYWHVKFYVNRKSNVFRRIHWKNVEIKRLFK